MSQSRKTAPSQKEIKDIQSTVDKIRRRLQKRYNAYQGLTETKEGKPTRKPVFIRYVFATGKDVGEFQDNPEEKLPNGHTKGNEPEAAKVERVFQQIVELALKAREIHLQHNFTCTTYASPAVLRNIIRKGLGIHDAAEIEKEINRMYQEKEFATMLPGKENDVTVLLTSEFLFWPCEASGAFTRAGVQDLITKLEKFADAEMPPNLRLKLGTFPFLNAEAKSGQHARDVRNVLLDIQCGSRSAINIIPKIKPYIDDPEYIGTTTPLFPKGRGAYLVNRIKNAFTKLMVDFAQAPKSTPVPPLSTQVQRLTQLCSSHPDHETISKNFVTFLLAANLPDHTLLPEQQKTALVDSIKKVYQSDYAAVANDLREHHFATDITTPALVFIADDLREVDLATERTPFLPVLSDYLFGRPVLSTTEGGIVYEDVMQICFDFGAKVNVADTAKQKHLHSAASTGDELLPRLVAQTISANTLGAFAPENILTKDFTVAQADPGGEGRLGVIKLSPGDGSKQNPGKRTAQKNLLDSTSSESKVIFGKPLDVTVYKPVEVAEFRQDILARSRLNNDLVLTLESWRHYRATHPQFREFATKAIIEEINTHFWLDHFGHLPGDSKQVTEFKDNLSQFLQQPIEDASTYRKALFELLDQQLEQVASKENASPFIKMITLLYDLHRHDEIVLARIPVHGIRHDVEDKKEEKQTVKQPPATPRFFDTTPSAQFALWLNRHQINEHEFHKGMSSEALVIFCQTETLNLEMFKAAIRSPALLAFIDIADENDLLFMRKKAKFLLLEPESFTHVFAAIEQMGLKKFHKLTEKEKLALFRMPAPEPKAAPRPEKKKT